MSALYICRADASPDDVLAVFRRDRLDVTSARLLSVGAVNADESTSWIGVEPVLGWVNLVAPEPTTGDAPGQWLHMGMTSGAEPRDMYGNTSDLQAVMFP